MRPAAVAGAFYPGDPGELAHVVADLLAGGRQALAALEAASGAVATPQAVLVPHAGYVYSGSTAAVGYAVLARLRDRIRRVVLLGPTHRVYVDGLALPQHDAFATPLGPVPVAAVAEPSRRALPQLVDSRDAHAAEHSLEVQLPFLQATLGDFELLPLAVGRATPAEVADVLDELGGGDDTVVVVSSDLSHYLPYDQAVAADAATLDQLLRLDGPISHEQACGATPVNGLLLGARRHGLAARLLGRCNSGDTAGDRRRVVGYAALAFAAGHAA